MLPSRWYAGYVFDLDGTIFLGDDLLPGVSQTLSRLRERGAPIRFLSNNCTKSGGEYIEKLTRLGLEARPGELVTPINTTIGWLNEHHPAASLLVLGSDALQRALSAAGFKLSRDASDVDEVVASYDQRFNFESLQIAFDAIWFHERAILIETNPDRYCPYPGGRGEPDAAAITAAIEACTGTTCVVSLGKPSAAMFREVAKGLGLPSEDLIMVGDRLATDIKMAAEAGVDSALVLTGDSDPKDVASVPVTERPTYVLESLAELLPA